MKQTIRLNESELNRLVKKCVKSILREGYSKSDGINLLKEVSETYIQLKSIEKDLSEYYKRTGYKPDGSRWYKTRNRLFELMNMNRGGTLHPYTHPFIDSLAEIMYKYGLSVNDITSLNLPPFNTIQPEKIEKAFSDYMKEMNIATNRERYQEEMNAQDAYWMDNSEYISKTTGVPEDEL